MIWQHYNPVKIYGGKNVFSFLPSYVENKATLLVTTAGMIKRETAKEIINIMPSARCLVQTVMPNPDIDVLDNLICQLRQEKIEVIIALGGGSVIDSAKALSAALACNENWSLSQYLRENESHKLHKALPLYCIPTTAGTGAEVTSFATIWDNAHMKKHSLEDPLLYPKAVFLSPELTLSLPRKETLWSALDALSHSMETLWNKSATIIGQLMAREAIKLLCTFLSHTQINLSDLVAREKLQQASCLAGIAISQSHTAIAHAISYPLTIHLGIPHGLACSFTLSALIELVDGKNLWRCVEDQQLAYTVAEFMNELSLNKDLLEFCEVENIYALASKMCTSKRASNFIIESNEINILDILQKSLSGCC
ncbi:MAG: iron-containing alcohol dehydrogenase [Holosporales bacterium]|jgi:alcohol dehydrogenase|nr:iron-containing alcohol dehydrogenase [Holosporales bacterium]